MKVASQAAKITWCSWMGGWDVAFFSWHLVEMTGGELWWPPLLFIVPLIG